MTSNELLKKYEEELIILGNSRETNIKIKNFGLAEKRETQIELVRRFIKDLKKLLF